MQNSNRHFSAKLHQSTAPFSHFSRHENLGFTAGIIGQRPSDGKVASQNVEEQCELMLSNLGTLLEEQGLGFASVVKTTVYLTDYADFEAINTVYARVFAQPFPARTTVQVAALPLGAKVQIDAVAALS